MSGRKDLNTKNGLLTFKILMGFKFQKMGFRFQQKLWKNWREKSSADRRRRSCSRKPRFEEMQFPRMKATKNKIIFKA